MPSAPTTADRRGMGYLLGAMQANGRPVYLLDDGGLMAEFVARKEAAGA